MQPRHSPEWLAWTLGFPSSRLQEIAASINNRYHTFTIPKPNGEGRQINNPNDELKELQRRIVAQILRPLPLPEYVQGSVAGRSPLTNAQKHVGQPAILRIDLRSFFPHVTNRKVYGIWCDSFGFGRNLSWLLTRLTTLDGHLPQGAPTSSSLANLALVSVDAEIERMALSLDLVYTRFVDDIVLSGLRVREIVRFTIRELSRAGFPCNREKIYIAGSTEQQVVTGYVVNHRRRVSIDRAGRDRVRAALHEYELLCAKRGGQHIDIERSLNGRIAHVRRSNDGAADRLQRTLDTITKLSDRM